MSAPNLTKFHAGYAEVVCTFNKTQMHTQKIKREPFTSSIFTNEYANDKRRHAIEETDILFTFRPKYQPHIGRSSTYNHSIARSKHPSVQTSLTGLQTIPNSAVQPDIGMIMVENKLTEDMLRLSILASIQIIGIAITDLDTEAAATRSSIDITTQISGSVTMHAIEKMWTGGFVRAVVPPRALFRSDNWNRGVGKSMGKISLVPVMVTPRDVTEYCKTVMSQYSYKGGADALRLVRSQRAHDMFLNFAQSFREFALTCGILFMTVMQEKGFCAVPGVTAANNPIGGAAAVVARNREKSMGTFVDAEGDAMFGTNRVENHGKIFYDLATTNRFIPMIREANDVAIFHGKMSGLLEPRDLFTLDTLGATPDAIEFARYAAGKPEFKDSRDAYDTALDRFFKMIFTQKTLNQAGGRVIRDVEEFGRPVPAAGGRTTHKARVLVATSSGGGLLMPTNDLFGKMLTQQMQAYDFAVGGFENMFNFNMSTVLGRVTQGCDRNNRFHFYYQL